MIILKKIILLIIITFLFMVKGNAVIKDSIFATVGTKVITTSDIINEIKIILVINGLSYSEEIKQKLDKSAIQSIIKKTIKDIEIEKYNSLKFNKNDILKEEQAVAKNLNMDVETLKKTFKNNGLDYSLLINQIKTDVKWNSLIFLLYKNRLSINLADIEDQLKKVKKKKETNEYLISEIILKPVESNNLENQLEEFYKEVEIIGFDNYAIEKSISETAIKGGNLGWISENSISKQFKSKIVETPVGKISEPIFLPQGILFFKIRDKRTLNQFVNLEDAKNQLVSAEKVKILNMYSLSHYDKLRRSVSIVYY